MQNGFCRIYNVREKDSPPPLPSVCLTAALPTCIIRLFIFPREDVRSAAKSRYGLTVLRLKLTGTAYKDPVRTAQLTLSVPVIQTSQLMLYREIIAVCSQIHTKHINTLCGQEAELYKYPVRTAQ